MNLRANDPSLRSWITIPENSDFSIQNIPFGMAKRKTGNAFAATIIGDQVIDLNKLFSKGFFDAVQISENVFDKSVLNEFISLGKTKTVEIRNIISDIFKSGSKFENDAYLTSEVLVNVKDVELLLPVHVGDYTDFFSSIDHATNTGKMFRDPANALLPNWKHLPVGYHGRSSSIFVSGKNFYRPKGQTKADDAAMPTFGPSRLLDFELEVGFIVGKSTENGDSIATEKAEDYIFGINLFNDWSARDIQKWEYVPLGPFLGKNFFSSMSPWIVTLEALEPYRVEGYEQTPEVLPYLKYSGKRNYDVNLEVIIKTSNGDENSISHSNFKYMYWNMCQQLAHHTVNGCNVNVGDYMASGTISGPTENSYGSMLEISWQGKNAIKMKDGSERKFILDNDTVIMRGFANSNGVRIGFGEVANMVLPAKA